MNKRWNKEKEEIAKAKSLKTDIDKAKFDLDNAFTSGDYEKASLIKYKKIPELEKQLQEIESNQKDGADKAFVGLYKQYGRGDPLRTSRVLLMLSLVFLRFNYST